VEDLLSLPLVTYSAAVAACQYQFVVLQFPMSRSGVCIPWSSSFCDLEAMFVDQNGIVTAEMKVINYFRRRDNFRCQVRLKKRRPDPLRQQVVHLFMRGGSRSLAGHTGPDLLARMGPKVTSGRIRIIIIAQRSIVTTLTVEMFYMQS